MLRLYEPCIPTRSKVPPSGPEWVHEIKHDGYRIIARKIGERVQLLTKGGYDWAKRYPLDCGGDALAQGALSCRRRRGGGVWS